MKVKRESEVAQLCLTPSDPMDCSLPGSSVHGICQARVLEWVAIASSEYLVYSSKKNRKKIMSQRFYPYQAIKSLHPLPCGDHTGILDYSSPSIKEVASE